MKMQWKRNAVVATVLLFVCAAVYLNWRYAGNVVASDGQTQLQDGQGTVQSAEGGGTGGGRVLGDASLVGGVPTMESQNSEDLETDAPAQEADTYFDTARLSRQQSRDNALSILREAAEQEGAEQASIDEANRAIQTLAGYTMQESQIENLVIAKGYEDCVAFMGENGISVVVSAGADGLQAEDAAKIMDIVLDETEYSADQIKILEAD